MKVFLLSDLVVHELISMRFAGTWLTADQFQESARLWVCRHGFGDQLSKGFLATLRSEAVQIAERLMRDDGAQGQAWPLERLMFDIHDVNYAEPLSANALAASLETCRSKLCGCWSERTGQGDAKERRESAWRCPSALRQLLCKTPTAHGKPRGTDIAGANEREA
ncbi:hypothetical protein PPMP20_11140 [Paraburkholderia phymatum]|uniref:Uncharacterized protein n=1 Tax=Paraburkholderia phymatum (strain DSM 17167 / CIP 108236 / LMG 21445 / STM815) TaxID=391038 RepID=B2JGV7_PARP8|nr:hypothetical protein [Paraburkholderia phymatum]ACC71741.1 hypothetical protein Bphy_2569 [Paraburkholderia phymatum STM815]